MANAAKFVVNGFSIPVVQELSAQLLRHHSPPLLPLHGGSATHNHNDDHSGGSNQKQKQGQGEVEEEEVAALLLSRYMRPEQERPGDSQTTTTTKNTAHLPVVDMSHPQFLQHLDSACRTWGFFQVINHGIELSVLDGIIRAGKQFFDLPLQERLKYSRKSEEGRQDGYGQGFVFSEDQILDWSDTFFLFALPNNLRNLKMWPPHIKDVVEDYAEKMEALVQRLLRAMAQNLGLTHESRLLEPKLQLNKSETKEEEANEGCSRSMAMRFNYYPACPRADATLGLSPHTDSGILTILLQQENVVGLQVRKDEDKWVAVEPICGALVVNVGDSLEVLSNGHYKSVEHRAVTNTDAARLSVAAFYYPALHELIAPASELLPLPLTHPHRPATATATATGTLYRSFTRLEYLQELLSTPLQGKAHSSRYIKLSNHHNGDNDNASS